MHTNALIPPAMRMAVATMVIRIAFFAPNRFPNPMAMDFAAPLSAITAPKSEPVTITNMLAATNPVSPLV